jgi:hypothetical protein
MLVAGETSCFRTFVDARRNLLERTIAVISVCRKGHLLVWQAHVQGLLVCTMQCFRTLHDDPREHGQWRLSMRCIDHPGTL